MEHSSKIALCLSGGGSRAVAYHLGCLKALDDYGILENVTTISSISGGSLMLGLYAYSDESFPEFEQKVKAVLRTGLAKKTLKGYLLRGYPFVTIPIFLGLILIQLGKKIFGVKWKTYPRILSRTNALIKAIESTIGDKLVTSKTRNNIEVIINSTNLDDGVAFRVGNLAITSWKLNRKFGTISNDFKLAEAIGASAAYPLFLPSYVRRVNFKDGGSEWITLSDGGVYENLGVTPFFKREDTSVGYPPVNPDYIIACDAEIESFPTKSGHLIISRLSNCFSTTMKRVRSFNFKVLNDLKAQGKIKGFVLSMLSMSDNAIPNDHFDIVSQEEVLSYPTDFSAMSEENIKKLSDRGYQITSRLVREYLPELID